VDASLVGKRIILPYSFTGGRAVKTGGPTRFRPAHSGFVGPDLKSLGKKRAAKSRSEPGPVRAFVPARFLKKKNLKQ
jgi:hypothetical protein